MSSISSKAQTASGVGPAELSAQTLHELAVQAFRVGNRGRLSLCESLRVLHETRLFLDLGFPSIHAYADAFFQLRRAEAFEYVRVANALVELTELREAFGQGKISWSVLKAVTRVASVESQRTWLDFARKHGVERTLAEARDALKRGRDKPRDSSFGLPNLDQRLVLRLPRSDMAKVRGWIASACKAVAEKTGMQEISVEQAILFLCEKDALAEATHNPTEAGNPAARRYPHRAQIVYQCCPDCRRTRLRTQEGGVEVSSEEVERFEGCAETEVIDGPTPPKLRRKILAREAGLCGNPRCSNRADHCHHIRFQSKGGKTCLANEVAVCRTCHALVHAGLLRVSGDACGELSWSPAAADGGLAESVAADRDVADGLPVLHLQAKPSNGDSSFAGRRESADADSSPGSTSRTGGGASHCGLNLEDLALGLRRYGVPAARSRQLIDAAIAGQPRSELTEANVLRRAFAAI